MTILIVDDDRSVQALLKLVLTNQGFLLLVASSGPEAITIAATFPDKIDLLLTDVQMPEMSGIDLALALSHTRPETRAIFITDDAGKHEGRLGGKTVLRKPFARESLLSLISREMNASCLLV